MEVLSAFVDPIKLQGMMSPRSPPLEQVIRLSIYQLSPIASKSTQALLPWRAVAHNDILVEKTTLLMCAALVCLALQLESRRLARAD